MSLHSRHFASTAARSALEHVNLGTIVKPYGWTQVAEELGQCHKVPALGQCAEEAFLLRLVVPCIREARDQTRNAATAPVLTQFFDEIGTRELRLATLLGQCARRSTK